MQKQGLSLDDFEEIVQFNLLSGKLAEHLFADKIESYFVEHQLDYTGAVIYEVVLADQAMASIETFVAIALRVMSTVNPSKIKAAMIAVEIQARMDGKKVYE